MGSNYERMAADVSPPIHLNSDIAGSGIYSRNILVGGEVCLIPSDWKGNYVTFYASAACEIAFGDSTLANTNSTRSTRDGTSLALTADAATGFPLEAGATKEWRVPKHRKVTHIIVRGPATSGAWTAHMSTGILTEDP